MKNKNYPKYLQEYKESNSKSITKFSKERDIDRGKFSQYLKKNGIEVINYHNSLKFNDSIFDNINTEEKAYWLGFLFADGAVSSGKGNSVELSLKLSDAEHLEKYSKFLENESCVKTDSYRCRVITCSKHFRKKLIELGCTPRKSLTLRFPDYLPKELIPHFIRGYFDGDGCFHSAKCKTCINRHLVFSLLRTKEFLEECSKYLDCNGRLYKRKEHLNNTYFINSANLRALNVGDYLYKDATIFLERKYNIYKQIAVSYRNISEDKKAKSVKTEMLIPS